MQRPQRLRYSRTPKRHERRGYRGQQGAADGSFDRAALAADQGTARIRRRLHLLLLLCQANLQRSGVALRLGGRPGKLEIHLHRAAGVFHYPVEARDVRRCFHLVSDRRDPNLQIRGARPLQARARRVSALSDRDADLLLAGIDAGVFRGAADAGAVLAGHAAGRRRRDRGNPAIAEGRRVSVADDVADFRVRRRVPAAGDPDAVGPDRHHHLETVARKAPLFHLDRVHHRRRPDAARRAQPGLARDPLAGAVRRLDPRGAHGGEEGRDRRGYWHAARRCPATAASQSGGVGGYSSCPGLSRASTSFTDRAIKTWMAGTSPAMTQEYLSCTTSNGSATIRKPSTPDLNGGGWSRWRII